MKATISGLIVALLFSTGALAWVVREYRLQETQLADYETHVRDLLSQVEDGSRVRLSLQDQLDDLQSERNTLVSQLTSIRDQLDLVQEQVSPDYQRMEAAIRQQLENEYQQRELAELTRDPRVSLINQLSALDPVELGAIMSVNGQYGSFLQALSVGDERKAEIINFLNDLIGQQNQSRQVLIAQLRNGEISRREMRSGLQDIMSPSAQQEALSQFLTDDELDTYRMELSNRRDQAASLSNFAINASEFSDGAVFFDGSGNAGTIIAPAQPVPPQGNGN